MPPSDLTKIVYWEFIGGEQLIMTGDVLSPVGFPAMLPGMIIEISPVNGVVRYQINGVATPTSHGYVPQGGARIIGPLSNWESISFIGNIGVIVCLSFYRDSVR